MVANVMALLLIAAPQTDLGSMPPAPPPVVDPQEQQRLRLLEELKRSLREADEELSRLLTESEQRRKEYQKTIDETREAIAEAKRMLANLRTPRARLPLTGLAHEYRWMMAEIGQAGPRPAP